MPQIYLVELEEDSSSGASSPPELYTIEQVACFSPEIAARVAMMSLASLCTGGRPKIARGLEYETVDPDRLNLVEEIAKGELVEVVSSPFTAYIKAMDVLTKPSFSFTTQDGQVLNEAETMELVGQEEIKILASFNTDALAAVQALVEYQNLDYRVYPDNWLEIVHGLQPITEHHRD